MTRPVLVLRPQPGADATAARAKRLGLEPVVAPLFRIAPRAWEMPEERFDALLLTSANAVRALDGRIGRSLTVYAVGAATADAARAGRFRRIVTGERDVGAVVAQARADGVRSILYLAGEDRTPFDSAGLRIETRIAYAAEPCDPPAAFADALARDAVALLHSARAAQRFRELAGAEHRIAAISAPVRKAAGEGWLAAAVAERPTDDALLAAAARLCQE
jgi:uroporphyrinogen-III synthase